MAALTALAELRDHLGTRHTARVVFLAVETGRLLGLPAHRLDQLRWAAALHDIGKLAVPEPLLGKSGPLTRAEWMLVRRHPIVGRQILEHIDALRDAARIVEQHHEHFDGTGYPLGLAGEAIHLEARILAAADALTSMTVSRSFRLARSTDAAVAELQRYAGTQFDPRVVDALVWVVRHLMPPSRDPSAA